MMQHANNCAADLRCCTRLTDDAFVSVVEFHVVLITKICDDFCFFKIHQIIYVARISEFFTFIQTKIGDLVSFNQFTFILKSFYSM